MIAKSNQKKQNERHLQIARADHDLHHAVLRYHLDVLGEHALALAPVLEHEVVDLEVDGLAHGQHRAGLVVPGALVEGTLPLEGEHLDLLDDPEPVGLLHGSLQKQNLSQTEPNPTQNQSSDLLEQGLGGGVLDRLRVGLGLLPGSVRPPDVLDPQDGEAHVPLATPLDLPGVARYGAVGHAVQDGAAGVTVRPPDITGEGPARPGLLPVVEWLHLV